MTDSDPSMDVPYINDVDKEQIKEEDIEVVRGEYGLYEVRWGPGGDIYYVNQDGLEDEYGE